jgi:hypothetical protein
MNKSDASKLFAVAALSLAVAACSGYTAVDLGGTVTGLTTDGLVLANGGSTVSIPANATSYKFPSQINDSGPYAVTIQTQPARLTCSLSNASGNTSGIAVTNVNVTCVPNTFTLGGTVAGLTGSGLTLNNGTDTVSISADGSFTFPTKVSDGAAYSVTVLTQPSGQSCNVANGTNYVNGADVTSVTVTCS